MKTKLILLLSTIVDLFILAFVFYLGVKLGRFQENQIQQKISLEFEKIAISTK
jgi:hypothetical protein